jgi:hypothetical protein
MEHRSQLQLQQQQQNIGPEGFEPVAETAYEFRQDLVLGVCFAILAVGALQRVLCQSREAEPVIFTFYCLILFTSLVRSAWLLVPSDVLEPSYAPQSVWAFSEDWLGTFISEVLCTAGSISMFAIFILMIIYWANLLKKVNQGARSLVCIQLNPCCTAALPGVQRQCSALSAYDALLDHRGHLDWSAVAQHLPLLGGCVQQPGHDPRGQLLSIRLGTHMQH